MLFLSLLLLLGCLSRASGLCNLENGTVARCHELEDVKYIETYDLESLKTSVADRVLSPGLFSNLSSLKHLDLSGGDLQHIEPGSFRKLVNLRSLDLSDNQIQYLELASLDGLNHLHTLNLRKNRFQQLPPALARLKILRHLDVQGNPLQCNCASLRVRDLIVKRNVKLSKKTTCVGPSNMKGTPLLVPDTTIVCNLEEQDREMQKDQPYEASGFDIGSGDAFDDFDEEVEEKEYVEVHNASSEDAKEPEIETPFPDNSDASTVTSIAASAETATQVADNSTSSGSPEKTAKEEDEIYLDGEEKKESTSTTAPHTTAENFKDALFYPVEGSGDDEEGSGEGSGTEMIFTKWNEDEEKEDEKSDSAGESILDMLFNVFWSSTTAVPEEKKEPDLEEEQFINISGNGETEEEVIEPKKVHVEEAIPSTVEMTTRVNLFSPTTGIELVETETIHDTSKLKNIKVEEEGINDELAEVSPARQSKKGMGSYVVLAALLTVLAALIGFAAYKGDFCKKKRKRGDVENGTELKDMQKALLDTGNATQPKIASNGNAESMPLVESTSEQEAPKEPNAQQQSDAPKSPNGTSDCTDPVKPPRRTTVQPEDQRVEEKQRQEPGSLKDDSLSGRTTSVDPSTTVANNGPVLPHPEGNGPPLSPGAQRVKITLQENPDSVPRTPILITRTLTGENLVKSP